MCAHGPGVGDVTEQRTGAGDRALSPDLAWTTPPIGTAELVLIVQDPDVPIGKAATHALTRGIDPALHCIPEGGLTQPSSIGGLKPGTGALGHRGWAGPMPVRSHGQHSYVFQLFALNYPLELPDTFTLAALGRDTPEPERHALTVSACAQFRSFLATRRSRMPGRGVSPRSS
ncbi:YbhB/YbcL family Raf kinase inhibitor-like protein [Leifsonia sp. Root112D2]|uniref:YbhB/YbcL family Raf kinase inhibitor-like protein n=1 Tax=Leifsonia sp. Root112D2 TaxID=1736426 RepID=UPI003FA54FD6